jgi:hypothetical protein
MGFIFLSLADQFDRQMTVFVTLFWHCLGSDRQKILYFVWISRLGVGRPEIIRIIPRGKDATVMPNI